MLTPEEASWLQRSSELQISCNRTHSIDCFCSRSISGQHDIKVGQVALLEAFVDLSDLFGGGSSTFELSVAGMIALKTR